MSGRCPHCGEKIYGLTAAQIALKNAVLSPADEKKLHQFVDFIIWKRKQRTK